MKNMQVAERLRDAIQRIVSVACDCDGRVCIDGAQADRDILDDALTCLRELVTNVTELETEALEQARIIGMGAERELKLRAECEQLTRVNGALQAKIDSLMLEYCPGEMTAAQTQAWVQNQRPFSLLPDINHDGKSEITASPVEINANDLQIDQFVVSMGGWSPYKRIGIRITHKPTGLAVEESSERSEHRNRAIAMEKLRAMLAEAKPAGGMQPGKETCLACGADLEFCNCGAEDQS